LHVLFLPVGAMDRQRGGQGESDEQRNNPARNHGHFRRAKVNARKANKPTTRRPGPRKKAGRDKKATKPKSDRANEKAQVIALMKRAKAATLAEIIKATGWQPHTGASAASWEQGR
jgi:hypothetical protein